MNDPRTPQPQARPTIAPGHATQVPHAPAAHAPHSTHAHASGVHVHRPTPQQAGGPQMIDPLVESSHSVNSRHGAAPAERVRMLEDEPIELVEEEIEAIDVSSPAAILGAKPAGEHKRIVAFGPETKQFTEQWKRQPVKTGTGACRVKSFHGKYSDEGLRYLDNAINHWLDEHPDIEVKFVTPTVMTFEGKTREPALVLNVWY